MTSSVSHLNDTDRKFSEELLKAVIKFQNADWGDTCKEDCEMNDQALQNGDDHIVAKYKTTNGDIFIITEHDRSATTILFAHEY